MNQVEAPVTGAVWRIECAVGNEVRDGDVLLILESMKVEFPVEAETHGRVVQVACAEGDSVIEGQVLVILEP